jgi:hypothetical protein
MVRSPPSLRRSLKNTDCYIKAFISSSSAPSTVAKRLGRHSAFGRSQVLTPVPPDLGFFQRFPHTIISWFKHRSHIISVPTHLPSVPIPNLPVDVAESALESLSSLPSGGMKDESFSSSSSSNM